MSDPGDQLGLEEHGNTATEWLMLKNRAEDAERQVRELDKSCRRWRAEAIGAQNKLRHLVSVLNSICRPVFMPTHDCLPPIPPAPSEDMSPRVRRSDFWCVCGGNCLTDGTAHWCDKPGCQHRGMVHHNKP